MRKPVSFEEAAARVFEEKGKLLERLSLEHLCKPDLTVYLGCQVQVVVDRPLGSAHPRIPSMIYPVNYGEIPNTVSGDGMPIDAYLLGWSEPLTAADGQVIAVIERLNDQEDKLVVTREGCHWTESDIWQAVEFQEKFFEVRLRR